MSVWYKRLFAFLVLTTFPTSGASGVQGPESRNLIQKEMAALDSALKTTVDALVLNDPGRISLAFDEVEGIRGQIELSIKDGSWITLPKNQKRFKEFLRLDNKFHRDIAILINASRKNHMDVVQREAHKLIDACIRCHTIFRD